MEALGWPPAGFSPDICGCRIYITLFPLCGIPPTTVVYTANTSRFLREHSESYMSALYVRARALADKGLDSLHLNFYRLHLLHL